MYMADRNFILCLAPALRALQNAEAAEEGVGGFRSFEATLLVTRV